ncbi:Assimilatory nitrate reductase electron transfer subunit [compost metagenome]
MHAIVEQGLTSVEEVKLKTKASGSCGGCRPTVEALVRYTLNGYSGMRMLNGTDSNSPLKQAETPVCDCTTLSHDMLKEAMFKLISQLERKIEDFLSDPIVNLMKYLEWRRDGGCVLCRPALFYYLEIWSEIVEGSQVFAAQEYTQAETIYRGVQLQIGVTDDLAAEKEGLWRIGNRLKTKWENVSLPYSLHAAIAENSDSSVSVLVHGIGICSSPAGYEVYLGGHAKHPVCEAQLIGVAENEDEAIGLAAACLEHYRQTAWYDEPIWSWMKRQDVTMIREKVLEEAMLCSFL